MTERQIHHDFMDETTRELFAYMATSRMRVSSCLLLMYLYPIGVTNNTFELDLQLVSTRLQITLRSIYVCIKQLQENNIIIVTRNPKHRGHNEYRLQTIDKWRRNIPYKGGVLN